ncbi:hypothetical protein [Polyangium sp. 6x1]|uniref:hypothetical protein n=1 Tax=Polyangium sp. 6x1 TaxID=3042689 RepID=UPI0024823A5D|nr:hypothetical protein [Polyangium sp. 6x1]MDI1449162.1 hypothetical protein [Polyangium sp. 6x1]
MPPTEASLEVGGLLCPKLFGDPPDPRRCAHIAMVEPVVPWPARLLLAPLLAMTEEELYELCYKDPAALLARVGEAEAARTSPQKMTSAEAG